MEQIEIFVAPCNYPSKGKWFTLPMPVSEIYHQVQQMIENEIVDELIISDYHAPLHISEAEDLDYLNELAEELENLPVEVLKNLKQLSEYEDIECIIQNKGENFDFTGKHNMADVARDFVDACGDIVSALGDRVDSYIDYEKLGRDISYDGNYFEGANGQIIAYVG